MAGFIKHQIISYIPDAPCIDLPSLDDHMVMNVTSMDINSTLTFSCVDGYELVGDSTMMCGAGGEWIGSKPQCIRKEVIYFKFILRCVLLSLALLREPLDEQYCISIILLIKKYFTNLPSLCQVCSSMY